MLEVQKYLKERGLEQLQAELSIKITVNDIDNRILLNYDQIKSPKTNPVVKDCRGLCLDKNDYSLIAKSFTRFFNYSESLEDTRKFNWNDCFALAKEDGTLISLYWYADKWQVQTRGSFGDIPMYDGGPTFEELFWLAVPRDKVAQLDKSLAYTFELCSRHNKVVRDYPEPTVFLLSVFEGESEWEFRAKSQKCTVGVALLYGFNTPAEYHFSSIEEVEKYIRDVSKTDKTYEGVVLRDCNNVRMKVKNPDYLCLHRLRGEGANLYLAKNLLPFILSGEKDELLTYFAEVKPRVDEMEAILATEYTKVLGVWNGIKGKPTRKEFALAVPQDLKLKSMLFTMLDTGEKLDVVWQKSHDLLLKALF